MITFDSNLMYVLNYTEDQSCCTEECRNSQDMCRCRKIEGVFVQGPWPSHQLATHFADREELSTIDLYCLERLLRYKADKDLYWEAMGDYYGELLRGIWFKNHQYLRKEWERIRSFTDAEKIKEALLWEYGYYAESIQSYSNVEVAELDSVKIIVPNLDYFVRQSWEGEDLWEYYNTPMCVVRMECDKHVLVDGYRRLSHFYQYGSPIMAVVFTS